MNNEINTMIELQHHWDIVLLKETENERHKKSIQIWEKHLAELKSSLAKKENDLKNTRLKSKQSELDLGELDTRIAKLEQRKDSLKSEREIEAQNNELKRLKEEKDALESSVLELMEQNESTEEKITVLKKELAESVIQTEADVSAIQKKISANESDVEEQKKKFNDLIEALSPAVKARFAKLINSKDGIAIAVLKGEICSHCNFQVPSAIAASAVKRDSVYTCTNCGRFIY